MEPVHRSALQRCHSYILDNLTINLKLVAALYSKKVITDEQKEDLDVLQKKSEKIYKLLDILPARGPNAFSAFLEVLEEDNEFVKKKIEDEVRKQSEQGSNGNTVKPPVAFYFPRQELEDKIKKCVKEDGRVCLLGPPGAGKTQLARRIVSSQDTKCDGIKAEIVAHSKESLRGSLTTFASQLKIEGSEFPTLFSRILEALGAEQKVNHVLILDNVTQDTYQLLEKNSKQPPNLSLIVTTNNAQLYRGCQVGVRGFTREEASGFFGDNFKNQETVELFGQLSFLPLGLATAKAYVTERQTNLKSYMSQLLDETSSHRVEIEEGKLIEMEGYNNGLISALQIGIDEIFHREDSLIFDSLSMAMFVDVSSISENMLKAFMPRCKPKITDTEKDTIIDQIVRILKRTSLGIVSDEKSSRKFEIHRVVQNAWILYLHKTGKLEKLRLESLTTLIGICDHDTRFSMVFNDYLQIMPHMVEALGHISSNHDELPYSVLQLHMCSILGHLCTQTRNVVEAKQYYQKGKFCLCRLAEISEETFDEKTCQDDDFSMSEFAKEVCDRLKNLKSESLKKFILLFITCRKFHMDDQVLWKKEKVEQLNLSSRYRLCDDSVDADLFKLLKDKKVVQPIETLVSSFLLELVGIFLYNYGRVFFFLDKKNVPGDEKKKYYCYLGLSYEIGQIINREYGFDIIHSILSQRNGLLYFKFEKKEPLDSYRKEIKDALKTYEILLKDKKDYFQHGFLKKTESDSYHQVICLRQLIKGWTELLVSDPTDKQARKEGLKLIPDLEEILQDLQLKEKHIVTGAAFRNQLARFHLAIGQEAEAIRMFEETYERERGKQGITYPLADALEGYVDGILPSEEPSFADVESKIKDFQEKMKNSKITNEELIKYEKLLGLMQDKISERKKEIQRRADDQSALEENDFELV